MTTRKRKSQNDGIYLNTNMGIKIIIQIVVQYKHALSASLFIHARNKNINLIWL